MVLHHRYGYGDVLSELVLALSTLLKFIAAGLALRLLWATRRRAAALLIASAILLIAIQSSIALSQILLSEADTHPDLTTELVVLLISVLTVAGLALIRSHFLEVLQANESIKKGEAVNQLILHSTNAAFIRFDSKGNCLMASSRGAEILERSPDEVVGMTVWDFGPYDLADRYMKVIEKVIETGVGQDDEFQLSATRHLAVNTQALLDDRGNCIGVQALVIDITERRQAEEKARIHAEQTEVIADLGQLALTGLEPKALMDAMVERLAETLRLEYCKVLALRPGGTEFLLQSGVGWKEGLVGNAVIGAGLDTQAGYTLARDAPVIVTDLQAETLFHGSSLLFDHDVVSGMSVIVHGLDGPFGVISVHTARSRTFTEDDINFIKAAANMLGEVVRRTRAEESKLEVEAQLRQTQKLEAIGTLASGVAHEINNPINGVMNYAQLIDDRLDPDSPLREFAKGIGRETERVATIVRNLLAFSRHEKESHSPARIVDIVNDTLSLVHAIIRQDQISLTVDIPDDLPAIKCRSQQIQQVIMNLLTNARDALNQRYPGYDPDKIMKITARQFEMSGRRWIRVTVEDHGSGITDEVGARVFDPFFTTKDRSKGTGLGLSISHSIAADHHGDLLFESGSDQSTKFLLELPVDNGWSLGEPLNE